MAQGFGQEIEKKSRRISALKFNIEKNNYKQADDIMLAIMEVFKTEKVVPEVGKYYTFVYSTKTKNVTYDEFPLVAVTSVEPWGFQGINFHWGEMRRYTWKEVNGKLLLVEENEINYMRSLQYAKFRTK